MLPAQEASTRPQFTYDPQHGVVSAGDLWRVKNGDSETPSGRYGKVEEGGYKSAAANVSTFSLGVDTASYSNVRRYLNSGTLPPAGAVRIEEMVNYFSYDYPAPKGNEPFLVSSEVAECPWDLEQRLVRIGVRTRDVDRSAAPPANLVFLVDVSGSMAPANRLPLVQQGFRPFIDQLRDEDRVSIVIYAGETGIVLESTPGDNRTLIRDTMDGLVARGSTRGYEAIQTSYRIARENHIEGGINRIILATDGDFNVGTTSIDELTEMIAHEAESGVSMTILGVGTNINDALMERVSRQGNATYHYLDTVEEARRVLVEQISGTLITVAEDFKAQVVFNPELVNSWRLVGYDTRQLAAEDFDDDSVKAGDIGAGLSSTILYQVVLRGTEPVSAMESDLNVSGEGTEGESEVILTQLDWGGELARVQFRYKNPGDDLSNLVEFNVRDEGKSLLQADDDFVFAAAVAGFGMLLRGSEYIRLLDYETVAGLAESTAGTDPYRQELVGLVQRAGELTAARGGQ
ncbi:MAG: von Willebrand factor type A domain-containing protein [Candidatus Sumerlaeia bacterium]|nr:von Willebrand factor type A domain-containing protein [Candidatus Sumerlaeia bacterium]